MGRVINGLKIIGSYAVSKVTKKARIAGFPIALAFEPTTSCNLRCPECPSGLRSFTRDTGMLEKTLFEQTIEELKGSLLYLTFYFQGEPYLHKDFLEMVSFASKHKVYTATSTNAHYLDKKSARKTVESGLDRLIVSIDGTSQETYEQYRVGGKLEKVIEGTKNIIQAKKDAKSSTPHVIFQFLVVKPNEHEIEDVKKLASELGVDEVRLKTAQIYDYEQGSPLIPTIDKYSRYTPKGDGTYYIKNKFIDHCWKMWHSCVITWDGKVIPCCFDKDAHYQLGSLGENSFSQVWKSPAYTNFRQSLIKSRSEIEMCKNCTEGTPVWG
ncbi:radical SAM additional 4Fe4S-binding SPASM domain-containing protein [Spirosomataceae bacterium TFI 002]|nr:radical SAM additional 4Fe4S-binding SPASM domain-containing protein [Spirosomataceae bacterium TFI 002]